MVVAGDKQLATAVRARNGGIRNVHVLETVEDLKELINTLVSKVTEAYINSIKEKVRLCFLDVRKENGVYFKANVKSSIREEYEAALRELPEGATERTNHHWFIQAPNFVKKSGQRTFWNTRVRVEAEAFKWSEEISWQPSSIGGTLGDINLASAAGTIDPSSIAWTPAAGAIGPSGIAWTPAAGAIGPSGINDYNLRGSLGVPETRNVKRKVGSGNTIFDVLWSVSVTTSKELWNPKVEEIKLIGTYWS